MATGKPCGKSFISAKDKCSKPVVTQQRSPRERSTAVKVGAVATGALALGGIATLARTHPWKTANTLRFERARRANQRWQAYEDQKLAQKNNPQVERLRKAREKLNMIACGPRTDADTRRNDAYKECSRQIGDTSAFGKIIRSSDARGSVFKIPTGNSGFGISRERAFESAANEALQLRLANVKGVSTPRLKAFNSRTGVMEMEYLENYESAYSLVKRGSYFTQDARKNAQKQFVDSMRKMHSSLQGHGDLHLGNIMTNYKTGDIKIIDFGFARAADIQKDSSYFQKVLLDMREVPQNYFALASTTAPRTESGSLIGFKRSFSTRQRIIELAGESVYDALRDKHHATTADLFDHLSMGTLKPNMFRSYVANWYSDFNVMVNYMERNNLNSIGDYRTIFR